MNRNVNGGEPLKGGSNGVSLRIVLLGLIFIAGFAVRLYHIHYPPLNYCGMRQHRSGLIARNFYFDRVDGIEPWRKDLASETLPHTKEPAVMEYLASWGYQLLGREALWIGRVLASVFWMVGGVFLYLLSKKLFSADGAMLSVLFYLFCPFGYFASRSFQPEAFMIMSLLVSLWMIYRYFEKPSKARLVIAGVITGGAILVKLVTVFPIMVAYLFAYWQYDFRENRPGRWAHLITFMFFSLLPGGLYYFYVLFISGSMLWVAEQNFVPWLLLKGFFWAGWIGQLGRVVGYIPLLLSVAGILLIRKGPGRYFLAGLWGGFFLFVLISPYGVYATPDWDLPVLPIAALSLGGIGTVIGTKVRSLSCVWKWVLAGIFVLFIGTALWAGVHISPVKTKQLPISLANKKRIEVLCRWAGLDTKLLKKINNRYAERLESAREIGQIVGHSRRCVYLSYNYGTPLRYYAEISGVGWPKSSDIHYEEKIKRWGWIPARERFDQKREKLGVEPEFFIITELDELEKQADLKEFLEGNYPPLARTDGYIIYDLRESARRGRVETP